MIAIRRARESAGITQAELARRLGVSPPLVARWESPSGHPKPATLERIAEALSLRVILTATVTFLPPPAI
jgi:transcriptional regulator with XRE-family HTH domain